MSAEFRMKLCETIVESCQLCNEFLPQYIDLLLSSLMTGLKDNESFIHTCKQYVSHWRCLSDTKIFHWQDHN